MNITDFIQQIEPMQATTKDASPEEDLQLMSITSMAISLKRIADAADMLRQRAKDARGEQVKP